MRRRIFWLVIGWLVGNATSMWFQRRLRRTVERYTPEHLRREIAERSSAVVDQGADLARRVRQIRDDIAADDPAGSNGHDYGFRRSGQRSRRTHRPAGPLR